MSSENDIPEFEPIRQSLKRSPADPPPFREEWFEMSPSVVVLDPSVQKRRFLPLAAAATVFLLAGMGLFLYNRMSQQVAPATVAARTGPSVIVLLARGTVTFHRGGQSLPLNAGSTLQPGDTVSANPHSEADLLLPDQSIVRLRGEGSLTLAAVDEHVRLVQSSGTTYHDVAVSSSRASYELQTPTAVAGVRGTRFEVTLTPQSASIHVTSGTVEVAPPDQKKAFEPLLLQPGESVDAPAHLPGEGVRLEKKNANAPESIVIYTAMEQNRQTLGADLLKQIADMNNTSDQGEIEKIYNRPLETLVLSDGTVLKGVVASQAGDKLILHTTKGIVIVPVENLQEIQYQK